MSIARDVVDLIQLLADLVRNTREFVDAVKDGRKFLKREHPEAKLALHDLLEQMQITLEGLAEVTAVVAAFRFTVSDAVAAQEASRFNAHVIDQHPKVARLRGHIGALKGSCDRIRRERDKLNHMGGGGWTSMFRLLGAKRRAREMELASDLSRFYADDQQMIDTIRCVLDVAERALTEAAAALGPAGRADPGRIEAAADVLGSYADAFAPTQAQLQQLSTSMRDLVDELNS